CRSWRRRCLDRVTQDRHGRPRGGHPLTRAAEVLMDGRDKPGHEAFDFIPIEPKLPKKMRLKGRGKFFFLWRCAQFVRRHFCFRKNSNGLRAISRPGIFFVTPLEPSRSDRHFSQIPTVASMPNRLLRAGAVSCVARDSRGDAESGKKERRRKQETV